MKCIDPGILSKSECFTFTPPETARKLFFYLTWCGHYYCNGNYFIRRKTFPHLLLVFVRDGLFHIEYRDHVFEAQKGDVVLLDCLEPHYYHAHNGLEFLYIHFDGSNAHELCQYILEKTGPLIRQDSNILIGQELYQAVQFYKNGGIGNNIQTSGWIYRLLEYLMTPDKDSCQRENIINDTILYIRGNCGKEISLRELAEKANLSPYYFAHLFKRETGFAPMEYVTNTRLEQSKILLARSNRTISDIAIEVGYCSASSLNNMFIKKTGMSPGQYRQIYKGSVD